MTKKIITSGCFDNPCSKQIRFLYEISQFGQVDVLLFADKLLESLTGAGPKFPLPERQYYLQSVRYVDQIHTITELSQLQQVSEIAGKDVDSWFVLPSEETPECRAYAESQSIVYRRITDEQLVGFPEQVFIESSSKKKVIVTGCFDWFHSGHVRFLEEASEYGDLYVVVGHDKNIKALKGPSHPMFSQDIRRFMVGAIRFVKQALISSGNGWLDAEPEIHKIKPDIYLVNEDGHKEAKRQFCENNGIEYVILKRQPKPGLQRRTSTNLRGF